MQVQPVTVECIQQASRLQNIPVMIILGLLKTEGGHLGEESPNIDGSIDLGPMQINNRTWIPMFADKLFHGDQNLTYELVRDQGCLNIHLGTWIFKQYLDEAHGNYAEAIGFYNSHNPIAKRNYQIKFAKNFAELLRLGK